MMSGTANNKRAHTLLRKVLPICMLILLLGGLLTPAEPVAAAPPNTGASLRLLTYNTAFVSADIQDPVGVVDVNDGVFNGLDYADRAKHIAARIRATDNDVVVLNEVFSNDAKDMLVNELKLNGYPYYIKRIEADVEKTMTLGELTELIAGGDLSSLDLDLPIDFLETLAVYPADSGLMIFSKYPFVPFSPGTQPFYDVNKVEGKNGPFTPWGAPNQISTRHFADCEGDDCFASKGAAMVRIQGPAGVFNVAFTHMQADYPPNNIHIATRERQFAAIKELIVKSLTPQELQTQPVYLLGDLNVPGQNKLSSPGSEWFREFKDTNNSNDGFFACGNGLCTYASTQHGPLMTDSWGFETSTDDRGISNAHDGARLDYILHSKPSRLCMQHSMIAYDLSDPDGDVELSDHKGVRADFNLQAPHCSPNDDAGPLGPQPISFGANQNVTVNGAIQFKGSMQWYKIGKKGDPTGTYTFAVNTNHVGFDVYTSDNLSNPVPAFETDPNGRGITYVLPEPPFYVRVYAKDQASNYPHIIPDRQWTGNYSISFHEHRGLSPSDALGLLAGKETQKLWPDLSIPGNIMTPDSKVWFKFYTDTSTSGQFPKVDFLVENSKNWYFGIASGQRVFNIELADDAAGFPSIPTTLIEDIGGTAPFDLDDDSLVDYRMVAPDLPGNNGPKRYFVTLQRRANLWNQEISSILEFRTTLTYIRSRTIYVDEEVTWGPGDDDITTQWSYDNSAGGPAPCGNGPGQALCTFQAFFINDEESWTFPESETQYHGSFAGHLVPTFWDDYGTNDQERLQPWGNPAIESMAPGSAPGTWGVAEDTFVWKFVEDGDIVYKYTMSYWTGHNKDWLQNYQSN
jgi:endonuclease/exonuclease/phosphatase family metal-dependent hydrolase